jgi:serine protease Do
MEDFFRQFDIPQQSRPMRGQGSGFIVTSNGYILTNNHVVTNSDRETIADKVTVRMLDHRVFTAKVVGHDRTTDVAVIKIDGSNFPTISFGDDASTRIGEWVLAIGNPLGLENTVTAGIISAKGRSLAELMNPNGSNQYAISDLIQTDAAINPGNSGGPLLNIRGEVIGINSAIYTDARQAGNIGIGFAIPINTVRELLPQLRGGKITRGMIGVQVGMIPQNALESLGLKQRQGALVSQVIPGSPSAKAGIEPGDVIVQFNGKPVKDRDALVSMVVVTPPNTTVPVKVVRDREEKTLNVRIGELDLEAEPAALTSRGGRGNDAPQQEASSGFGMSLSNITPDVARRLRLDDNTKGAVVVDVDQASPAARAGIMQGDVIMRVGRAPIGSVADASRELARIPSGGTAILRIMRNGQDTAVVVTKE